MKMLNLVSGISLVLSLLIVPALADVPATVQQKPKCIPTDFLYGFCRFFNSEIPLFIQQFSINKQSKVIALQNYILERQREHFYLLNATKAGEVDVNMFGKLNSELMQSYNKKIDDLVAIEPSAASSMPVVEDLREEQQDVINNLPEIAIKRQNKRGI